MLSVASIVRDAFGFVRQRMGTVLRWCAAYMAVLVLTSLLMRPVVEAQLAAMAADPPGLATGGIGRLLIVYAIMAVSLIALFGAVFRSALRPADRRAGYLRFGPDELRLLGLITILMLITLMANIIVMIVALLLGFFLSGGALGPLIYCGLIGSTCWIAVRLSAAAPLTILRRRIVIAEAWRLTHGRFWTLLGGYLVVLILLAIPGFIFLNVVAGGFYHQIVVASYEPQEFVRAMRDQLEQQAPGRLLWLAGIFFGGLLGGAAIALQGAMTSGATRRLMIDKDIV